MYISGIIFFFRMHFMCIFIYVGLLYCSVFISYTFLMHRSLFFTSHITSNTVFIKHSGRNCISVCHVIYLFFVDLHVWVHLFVHLTSLMFESHITSVIPVSYNYNISILWSTEPGTNAQYSQSEFNIAKYYIPYEILNSRFKLLWHPYNFLFLLQVRGGV